VSPAGPARSPRPLAASVRLRDARAEELGALEALQRRSASVWEEDRAVLAAHPDAVAIPPAAAREHRLRVAADPADRPLGFAHLLPVAERECELDALFVEPEVIGQGLGRVLLQDAVARARGGGAAALFVVSGPGAQGFYERMGFRRLDAVPTPFGPAQQLVMAL
jgi:N-acetylglutamate synthase-like GNAT family acetyltransferase